MNLEISSTKGRNTHLRLNTRRQLQQRSACPSTTTVRNEAHSPVNTRKIIFAISPGFVLAHFSCETLFGAATPKEAKPGSLFRLDKPLLRFIPPKRLADFSPINYFNACRWLAMCPLSLVTRHNFFAQHPRKTPRSQARQFPLRQRLSSFSLCICFIELVLQFLGADISCWCLSSGLQAGKSSSATVARSNNSEINTTLECMGCTTNSRLPLRKKESGRVKWGLLMSPRQAWSRIASAWIPALVSRNLLFQRQLLPLVSHRALLQRLTMGRTTRTTRCAPKIVSSFSPKISCFPIANFEIIVNSFCNFDAGFQFANRSLCVKPGVQRLENSWGDQRMLTPKMPTLLPYENFELSPTQYLVRCDLSSQFPFSDTLRLFWKIPR